MPDHLFLAKPLTLADGRRVRTVGDAQEMIRHLPPRERGELRWQLVAAALLIASRTCRSDCLLLASTHLERALLSEPLGSVRLADEKKPAAPSLPRPIESRLFRRRIGRD